MPDRTGCLSGLGAFFISWLLIFAWFTGIWESAADRNVLFFFAELVIPPIGVIHGLLHWFGVI